RVDWWTKPVGGVRRSSAAQAIRCSVGGAGRDRDDGALGGRLGAWAVAWGRAWARRQGVRGLRLLRPGVVGRLSLSLLWVWVPLLLVSTPRGLHRAAGAVVGGATNHVH